MKNEKNMNYEAPVVELLEIAVEQGFAVSNPTGGEDHGNGSDFE